MAGGVYCVRMLEGCGVVTGSVKGVELFVVTVAVSRTSAFS